MDMGILEHGTTALSKRVTDEDGAVVEIFPLAAEAPLLEAILRDLFHRHWDKIVFGPIIQGSAWEFRAPHAPSHFAILDGYLTVAFGASHFHLCIGETRGPPGNPTPLALGRHRQCAKAELFRRLDKNDAPVSWGLRLANGHGEQQTTIFFPNPFLSPDGETVLRAPEWPHLALWDEMRARYLNLHEPDPIDRKGRGFSHE